MIQPPRSTERCPLPSPLGEAEAVLIALASRRFVIVHGERSIPIWSAELLCRPVREFRRGEPVYYKGRRDQVRAMTAY